MGRPRGWELTPRESIDARCRRRGKQQVVGECICLIEGGDGDSELLFALAGPAARALVDDADREDRYWLRVWGTRGLLWAWDDQAVGALRLALRDESWRVREMAAKVVRRHVVGGCLDSVAELVVDPVPRVRSAAHRALVRLTEADA